MSRTRVPLATGRGQAGAETGYEFRSKLQQLMLAAHPSSGPDVEFKAAVRYQIANTVPEHWVPFVPVHLDDEMREIQLQRASLPRILENDPGVPKKIEPRTSLLREGLDATPPRQYFVHEEEVSRAGVAVRLVVPADALVRRPRAHVARHPQANRAWRRLERSGVRSGRAGETVRVAVIKMEKQRRGLEIVFSTNQANPPELGPPRRFSKVKAVLFALLAASVFIGFLIAAVVLGSILAVVLVVLVGIAVTVGLFKAAIHSARR